MDKVKSVKKLTIIYNIAISSIELIRQGAIVTEKFLPPRSQRTSGSSVVVEVPLRRGEDGRLTPYLTFTLLYDPENGKLFSRKGYVDMTYNSPEGIEIDLDVYTGENVMSALQYLKFVKEYIESSRKRPVPPPPTYEEWSRIHHLE